MKGSSLALLSKFLRSSCLTHVGREGCAESGSRAGVTSESPKAR
jgi:hypothetical protein